MARAGNPVPQISDDAGKPFVDAELSTFESDTSTRKDTFSDVNETIKNDNPILIGGGGRWPNIFFTGIAKQVMNATVKGVPGVQIWERDPVGGTNPNDSISNWSALIIYNINDLVQGSNTLFYKSITNGNINNDPTQSPEFWEEFKLITVWNPNVDYALSAIVIGSDGLQYRSLISNNSNNDPTVSPSEWGPTTAPIGTDDIQGGAVTYPKLGADVTTVIEDEPNGIINGAFDRWERATTQSTSGYGSADRWDFSFRTSDGGVGSVTRTAHSVGAMETSDSEFFAAFDQTTAPATNIPNMEQLIEDVWTYSDEVVTVSFRAKLTSGTSDIVPVLTQKFGSGGSSDVVNTGTAITLTGAFADFSQTFTLASILGKTVGAGSSLGLMLNFDVDVFRVDVSQVQIQRGSVATKFSRAGGTKGGDGELAKRYYMELNNIGVVTSDADGRFANNIPFPVTMRTTPSITVVLNGGVGGDFGQADPNSCRQTAVNSTFDDSTIKLDAELS